MKAITSILLASALTAAAAPDKEKLMKEGQANYANCLACHGADGKGFKAGPMLMAPSLSGSKVANGDPELLAQVILRGIKKEGNEYLGMMAPLGAVLDDNKLASVMTYVRGSFDNKAEAVTPEQVKAWREKYKDKKEPISRAEIAELLKKAEEAKKKEEKE